MAGSGNNQIVALPPPYLGEYDLVPVVALQNPYCQILINFNMYDGMVSLRHGDAFYCRISITITDIIVSLKSYNGDSKFFCMVELTGSGFRWYDITTSTPTLAHSEPTLSTDREIHANEFNKYLYYWGENSLAGTVNGVYYTGSAWATTPYTYITAGFHPIMSFPHRNRNYIVSIASNIVENSSINGTTGATTDVIDYSSIFTRGGYIYIIRSMSISDNVSPKYLLVLVNKTGETLLYDGTYQGSSDWELVGNYQLPRPVWYESVIDYRGDVLLITEGGLLSLRTLIMEGQQAAIEKAFTRPIVNRWRQIIGILKVGSLANLSYIKGIWDSYNDRLIIQFPNYYARDGSTITRPFFLVYDLVRNAWTEHVGAQHFQSYKIERFQEQIYYTNLGSTTIYQKEASAGFADANVSGGGSDPYIAQIRSAPFQTPRTSIVRTQGIEVLTKGDYYTIADWTLIGDLGTMVSGKARLPAQGTGVLKPFVNIGMLQGTYMQWDLSFDGSAAPASIGCEIYGVNEIFEAGGVR